MERALVLRMTAETGWQRLPHLNSAGNLCIEQHFFFAALLMSVNDHVSDSSIELGLQINFSE